METVLAGFILIFVILFAILTLSGVLISTQDAMATSWQEMQDRADDQSGTQLSVVNAEITNGGSTVEFTLVNSGTTKLIDFNRWDVFAAYFDEMDPVGYHILRLEYAADVPAGNQWAVTGIFQDAANDVPEAFEPLVLNPGEEAVLTLQLTPQIGHGTAYQLTLSTGNGSTTSGVYSRNALPDLVTNVALSIAEGGAEIIDTAHLEATDQDNEPTELTYSVTTTPTQGTLNLGDSFTQDDIDQGLLVYTHSGVGDDSLQFVVSDGEETVGPFTFEISISQ